MNIRYYFFKRILYFASTLLMSFVFGAIGFAVDTNTLGMGEFVPFADKAGEHDYTFVLMFGLLLLFVVSCIVFWLSKGHSFDRAVTSTQPQFVDHLFLKLNLSTVNEHTFPQSVPKVVGKQLGPQNLSLEPKCEVANLFLRSLGLDGAIIISSVKYEKNAQINLDFSSLPNFPSKKARSDAQILSCRPYKGDQNCFLLKVKFNEKAIEGLPQYIEQLSSFNKHSMV